MPTTIFGSLDSSGLVAFMYRDLCISLLWSNIPVFRKATDILNNYTRDTLCYMISLERNIKRSISALTPFFKAIWLICTSMCNRSVNEIASKNIASVLELEALKVAWLPEGKEKKTQVGIFSRLVVLPIYKWGKWTDPAVISLACMHALGFVESSPLCERIFNSPARQFGAWKAASSKNRLLVSADYCFWRAWRQHFDDWQPLAGLLTCM